jgi:predicted solute-binding protein
MRIGITPYLNAVPYAFGLKQQPGIELVYASPAGLADLLRKRMLDAALVSSTECFSGDYHRIPGYGIASSGGGSDALLLGNVPLINIRSIALDAASRSTNLFLRLLMTMVRPGAAISYAIRPSDSCRSLEEFDACLLIGDAALSDSHEATYRWDLAQLWLAETELPMVMTLWLAHPGNEGVVEQVIDRAYQYSLAHLDELLGSAAYSWRFSREFIHNYWQRVLTYELSAVHEESIRKVGAMLSRLHWCRFTETEFLTSHC